MYLCAIIDLHTRYVVNWSLSNTMTAEWCAQVAQEAIEWYGAPDIFNTDQGSQFTVNYLPGCLRKKIYRSAWTVREGLLIIFLLNDCGEQ